ncbi:MAG: 2-amino-4-hydroxy-6-hydroxymethyldihydropteridine diphosphokinase [Sphingomonadales bacterium]|nr:2-amino-4-hydroxy-6-hydroxymethyldihydropteridine diphosphokinase [Sphingomonadales bacterium]MDE2568804.1 2-amino-4-hydroxy-6-hydroxymethyldihydropteridine diphosphokinase [Sphingomonadales bacterium]
MSRNQGLYLVALGSNMRHPRHGLPRKVLRIALAAMEDAGIAVLAASPAIESLPLGPSLRRYANAAALVRTGMDPPALLAALQRIERAFGRKHRGMRWRARVLDLDIVLWSGGAWRSDRLTIPHPEFRNRAFVLTPANAVAPGWRDPATGRTIAQLSARLTRRRPAPR